MGTAGTPLPQEVRETESFKDFHSQLIEANHISRGSRSTAANPGAGSKVYEAHKNSHTNCKLGLRLAVPVLCSFNRRKGVYNML